MPPAKSSGKGQDDKGDALPAKERSNTSSAKMRRNASQTSATHARDVTSAPTSAPTQNASDHSTPTSFSSAPSHTDRLRQLPWASFDRDALHAYRRENTLPTPTSFASTYHQWILSQKAPTSIGRFSPTMVRKRAARRQSKDHLALAVRKHFNGVGIQENDVIVDFISKIRSGKSVSLIGTTKQTSLGAE